MSRRVWRAHDARFTADPAIEDLGERFGPGGPLAVSVLLDMAKMQYAGGQVSVTFRELAHDAFLESSMEARAIVEAAIDGGLIKLVQEVERGVVLDFPRWSDWQGATSAERMRKHRARAPNDVTGDESGDQSDAESANSDAQVTSHPPCDVQTGQDSTSSAKASDVVEPDRLDRANGRLKTTVEADLFAYWQERCGHSQAKLSDDRRRKIQARLREGYTAEQIRQAIDGAAVGAVVSEDGRRRFDDLELICRNGSKLESFMQRAKGADKPLGEFVAGFGGGS